MPPITRSAVSRPAGVSTLGACSADAICERVARAVAEDFRVDRAMLFARTRGSPRAALARQAAMYLVHTVFAISFAKIGKVYRRDRTTVAHACRRIEEARDSSGFDGRLRRLELRCRPERSEDAAGLSVTLKVVR